MHVAWYINRALSFIRPYKGECCRKTKLSGDAERKYYKPGKIFRFQNIISAVKGDGSDNSHYDGNLWFHIFS